MKKLLVSFPFLLFFALPAISHPGHGHVSSDNPLHYIAEPLHALVLVVVLAAVGYGVYRFRKQKKQS
ncbi:MAG: hypothetical protein MUE71_00590 [Chitinophagaceae bacterium]|nr:hypothetical protein [Chitinophagaceae bacterium]MCU0405095.1 hypothetical protein [Chitinophagaceae bacterium]